ncbi:RNA-binding protein 7 [Harmonia axyridis]|uniref:RNA-binding protein 7 n=1 Tax=Harmonia axyridis TaxID=115357 RepID=UPI001E2799F3|nr:RNA-binding protein 7 [Harmonia axyridis]
MDDDERTIWCGNLSDKVTEEILYELFLQAAPLQRVNIPQDKQGRKSNFGFIVFKHVPSVEYAVQLLNGTNLFDKPLNLKPRSKASVNDNKKFQFQSRDRLDDSHRRDKHNDYMEQDCEPNFQNLMQMGQMMRVSPTQPAYSSSVDRRGNNFNDFRNNRNHQREDRKPYSRNKPKFNSRNHNRSFDRPRYY